MIVPTGDDGLGLPRPCGKIRFAMLSPWNTQLKGFSAPSPSTIRKWPSAKGCGRWAGTQTRTFSPDTGSGIMVHDSGDLDESMYGEASA